MENLIKLDFGKMKDNYGGLDWSDKKEIKDISNIYAKKEDAEIEGGYCYSVYLEYNNTKIVPYFKHDLKEEHIKSYL